MMRQTCPTLAEVRPITSCALRTLVRSSSSATLCRCLIWIHYRPLRHSAGDRGLGDHEVRHLVTEAEVYCVVYLEEQGRQIRVQCREEGEGLGPAYAKAWSPPEPRLAQQSPCRL